MKYPLHIAPDIDLPLETITQAIAIISKRRAGKSYLMRRIAEQIVKAGQQIVIVDPKGDQWGIRFAADGKSPGMPVTILGGEHGDADLKVDSGEVVAKFICEECVSVLLDLSLFRKYELHTFMTAFLENLYRLKAREKYRTPMMLVIDEADAIAPQQPPKGAERMLGAAEDIVRRGGQRGLGCLMVTQRSAVLNKNVLTQVQILIALRTIAPQDLKALKAWIDLHGSDEEQKMLMESLPTLPIGDAWYWSPGWPTTDGIFTRSHTLPIETFDSGATPKAGQRRFEPKNAATIDIDALKRQMADAVERAKASDPKELTKRIATLTAELATAKKIAATPVVAPASAAKARDQATIIRNLTSQLRAAMKLIVTINAKQFADDAGGVDKKQLEAAVRVAVEQSTGAIMQRLEARNDQAKRLKDQGERMIASMEKLLSNPISLEVSVTHNDPFTVTNVTDARAVVPPRERARRTSTIVPSDGVSRGEQRILNALAELQSVGIYPASRPQLAIMSSYNLSGGTGAQNLANLVTKGLVQIPEQGMLQFTYAGAALAVADDAPASQAELHERVYQKLSDGQQRILRYLISIHPAEVSRTDLGEAVQYNLTGGTGAQNLADLVTLKLATIPRKGSARASDILFPAGLR